MPTSPSQDANTFENRPHRHRDIAESFGTDAERYDRTRPRYPDDLVDRIVGGAALRVLDVGCGTGIAARQFMAAGCTVLGVDPDARMAERARRDGLEVEVATFEDWDPAGRAFDAVIAAQAWHWVDPAAGAAKAARALRPGGRLAVFWNVPDLPPDVAEAIAAAYQRVMPDSPIVEAMKKAPLDSYAFMLAKAGEGFREAGGFDEPVEWRFDWEWSYGRDEWLEQMRTHGGLTRLPQDAVAAVLNDTGAAIDRMGGSFTANYATVALAATRSGTA